jgi:TP901 family phage tail tape measure protein
MAQLTGLRIETNISSVTKEFDNLIRHINDTLAKPFNIKFDINKIQEQIQEVTNSVAKMQEQINQTSNNKPILDSTQTQEQGNKIGKTIEQIKEQLSSLGEVQIKYTSFNETTQQFDRIIAKVKETDGIVKQFNADISGMFGNNALYSNLQPVNITDNTQSIANRQAIEEQNQQLQESLSLLKQEYNLESDISSAKQKGRQETLLELQAQQQLVQSKLAESATGLNNDNRAKLIQQASQYQNQLNSQIAQESDKVTQVNTKLEQQVAQFKDLASIKLQNLETSILGASNKGADVSSIKEQVNSLKELSSAMNASNFSEKQRQWNTELKQTQANLKSANAEARNTNGILGDIIGNIGKFAQWSIAATALMAFVNGIKDAITYVNQMDDATADLSKVVDMSTEQLNNMKDAAVEMGKELGQSSLAIMQGFAETARVLKNPDDIEEFTKTATMAANVTDLSVAEASKSLTTTMISYHQNVSQVKDDLDQLNEIQNNFRASAGDVSDGLAKVGSAASQAGVPIQNLEGYITALVSATGITGSEAGTALQSFISRTFRIGSEGVDDAGKTEKALSDIGVQIRDAQGNFKSFSTILDDTKAKWDGLSNAEQVNIGQQIGSQHHYSQFIALMNNYKISQDATTAALNSNNSAVNENAKYLDSWSGKIGTLKAATEGFYNSLTNSNITKGFVDILSILIKTFGNLPMIITATTTAFLLFKGTAITGAISSVGTFISSLGSLVVANGLATTATTELGAAMNLLKVAFLSNPIGMIALAVTGAVSAFMIWKQHTQNQIDKLDELSQKSQQTQSDIASLKEQASTLDDLTNKTSLNADEKAKLKQTNDDIASKYPELISYYDKESGSFQVNIEKLDELIKKKQELAMQENANGLDEVEKAKKQAQDAIDKANAQLKSGNGKKDTYEFGIVDGLKLNAKDKSKLFDTIRDNQATIDKSNQSINQSVKNINDYSEAQKKAGASTDEINNALKGFGYTQKQIDNAMKMSSTNNNDNIKNLIQQYNQLSNSGNNSVDTQQRLASITSQLKGKYGDLEVGVDSSGNAIIKNTDVLNEHARALGIDANAVNNNINQTKPLIEVQKDLSTAISKAQSNISSITQVLNDHAESGEWNIQTILNLAQSYPNLLSVMGDDKALTEELMKAKEEEKNTAESSLNEQINLRKNEVNAGLQLYGLDISNFADAQSAKTALAQKASGDRIAILEKELQAQATASDQVAKDSHGKVTGRGGGTPYDSTLQKLNQAKAELESTNTNIDEYFNLQKLKANADNIISNIGNENYDGKKNTTTKPKANTAASKQLTAQSRDLANKTRDIANQSRNLDMQNQDLKNKSNALENKSKALDVESKGLDAQRKALELQKQKAEDVLEEGYKAEQQQEDAIIKKYQAQLDVLQKKKDLQDATNSAIDYENKIKKDQLALDNAQNEKTVLITENGQAMWVADQTRIDSAREALAKDQEDYRRWQSDQAIKNQEDSINDQIKVENDKKDADTTAYNNQKDAMDKDYQNKENAIDAQKDAISNQKDIISSQQDAISQQQQDIQNKKTNLDNAKNDIANQQNSINDSRNALDGYAEGTNYADAGIAEVAENGYEIVIGRQTRKFQGGEQVIPHDESTQILNNKDNSNSNNVIGTKKTNVSINPVIDTDTVTKKVKATLDAAGKSVENNKNLVKNPTNDLLGEVDYQIQKVVNESPQYSKDMNNNIGQSTTNNKNLVKTPLENLINEVKNQLQQFVDGSGQYGKNSDNNIGNAVTNNVESVYSPTRTLITNVRKLLDDFVTASVNTGKGIDNSIGQGIIDNHDTLMKTIDTISKNMVDQFNKDLDINSPSKVMYQVGDYMMQGLINGMDDADIEKFITDKVSGMTGAINGQVANVPGSVTDWLKEAIKLTGVSDSWLPALQTIAMKESSGNPNDVNRWDSNWVAGHPSQGLMQTIPSTFAENMVSGHNQILNPIDNAAAAINYIKKRYGTVSNVPGIKSLARGSNYVGYQTGTNNATPGMHELSEDGRPEIVIGKQARLFNGGETVLNGDKTMNILQSLMPKFEMPDFSNLIPRQFQSVDNSKKYSIQHVEIVQPNDFNDFVTQFEQYVTTHT